MAGARDQAARVVRTGPEATEGEATAPSADQPRTPVAEENRRRPQDAPGAPPADRPAAPPADRPGAPPSVAAGQAAPKSGKRKKFVMMGVLALLAIAAASYATYYVLVGRF